MVERLLEACSAETSKNATRKENLNRPQGHTVAFNQSDGSTPVSRDCIKMTFNIGNISLEQCFKINGEILSGLLALLVSSIDS